MSAGASWRPIAECPPDLRRAVVFDPGNVCLNGSAEVDDERVVVADRHDGGRWWVDHYQGGYDIEPTHFLDPGVPDGFPAIPDPEPLRLEAEARRAEDEARRRRWEAERTSAAAEAAAMTPERAAELDAAREAFWSDPDNLRRYALGGD